MATQPDDRKPDYVPETSRDEIPRDQEPQINTFDVGDDRYTAPKDGSVRADDEHMTMPRPPLPLTTIIVLVAVAVIVVVAVVFFLI